LPQKTNDIDWLAAAARLGLRGRPSSSPNPSVGAIIVKDGRVIGRGWTQDGGRPHGEAQALFAAGEQARGATLYCTLEPCAHKSDRGPSCSSLIADSGIDRLVYAVDDPDPRTNGSGASGLRERGVETNRIDCAEAAQGLAGYLTRQSLGRPHVTLKLAMSLDGKIALPSGESQWITSEQSRAHVHSRRAMADAILVGGRTWRADKPRLDVRLPGLEDRSPKRVVLTRGVPIDDVKIINTPDQISRLENVLYLYVEGGAGAAASFLKVNLVDRLEIYRAPIVIGDGLPALTDFGLSSLAEAHGQWLLVEKRKFGPDVFEAFTRKPDTEKDTD